MNDSSSPPATLLLFVYGSLKRGQPNHHELGRAHFVGIVRTRPGFALRLFSGYPLLVRGTSVIFGELFELPLTHLASLDAFEGEAYQRAEIELEDGRRAVAYLARDASCGAPYAAQEWPAR